MGSRFVRVVGKYIRNWSCYAHPTGKFFQTLAECGGYSLKYPSSLEQNLKP
ncbi:hypothetical protein J471_4773, partial [Acinetobacter baumannii 1032359]